MALQMSSLLPHCKVPLSRVRANFQGVGVRFKHVLSPGIPHCARKPAVGLSRTRSPVTAEKFSTTARSEALWRSAAGSTCSASSRKTSGLLGRVVLGVAAGVSSVAVVQALHTGSLSAMARRVNLESAEGNWKETKDFLLSQPVHDRRQFYRTASYVPLDDIPVWTPLAAVSDKTICQRNEKLDQKISLYSGDLTKLEIDAIVNAANKTLLGGGGVDGAIHRAAGPLLKKECSTLQGCDTGEAKITGGYGLPAKYVIHTVGPIAQGRVGEEEKKTLRACYRNSLEAAASSGARSVAFPCISTGIYGYPPDQAVHEALAAVREFLDQHHDKLLQMPQSRANSERVDSTDAVAVDTHPPHSTSRFLLLLLFLPHHTSKPSSAVR
ncbi:ADP-ribose glycohydrolase MACROD1 isoform X1 [Nelusetta ayraudi]|uniref:ADP-ribose glycohydrolase MACROD1 isoform X1 n=1 Tax=Nelusetta ayraudi TaxID=303726 RepID=UPI003F6E50F1